MIKALMPNADPLALLSGLMKFADLAANCQEHFNAPPSHDVCCCHDPNGPAEIIHFPGEKGVPLCKADPKKVIDALFPPLPAAAGAQPGDATPAPGQPGGKSLASTIFSNNSC